MLVVRPADIDDLDGLVELARLAGPGFTSLAVGAADLQARLHRSVKSFAAQLSEPGDQIYLLMLEDQASGEVVGISAVKARVGATKPFFSFKILNIAQSSSVANRHFDMQVMLLVNEYSGSSEVGTLFIKSKMRGTGAGRLISQARYMLIAGAPERFAKKVISELRGRVDAKGYSPFWESLGRKFFKMDFDEADKITAETDNQFITDLMPKYPIYTALLPEDAQAVVGQTHPDGIGARRLLEAEGFRYEECVDIFDAGPTMVAPREHMRTVRDSQLLRAGVLESQKPNRKALISNNQTSGFRAVFTDIRFEDDNVLLSAETLSALQANIDDPLRVFVDPVRGQKPTPKRKK